MKGIIIFFTIVILILICVFAYFATKNMHENFTGVPTGEEESKETHPCFGSSDSTPKKGCVTVKVGEKSFYAPDIPTCDVSKALFVDDDGVYSCSTCPTGYLSNGVYCESPDPNDLGFPSGNKMGGEQMEEKDIYRYLNKNENEMTPKTTCSSGTYENLSNWPTSHAVLKKITDDKKMNELKFHYSNYKTSNRDCKSFTECNINDSWVDNYDTFTINAYDPMFHDMANSGDSHAVNDSTKKYFEDISCETLTTEPSSTYFVTNEADFTPVNIPGTTQNVNIADRIFKKFTTNCPKGTHISNAKSTLPALTDYYTANRFCNSCNDNTYSNAENMTKCVDQPMCSAGQLVPIKYVDNPDTDASITKKEQIICKNLDENSDCPKSTKNVPGCYMDKKTHREWKYMTRKECELKEDGEEYVFNPECVNEFKNKGKCLSDKQHSSYFYPTCPA